MSFYNLFLYSSTALVKFFILSYKILFLSINSY